MNSSLPPELEELVRIADLSADALSDAADKAAAMVQRLESQWKRMGTPERSIHLQLRRIANRHHITLPNKTGLQQIINRLADANWWKRALRKRFQIVEYAAIQAGSVHAQAGKYVSDKTMSRAIRNKRRIEELLASLVAINQTTGEMRAMDELAAQSLSNPENRRKAMMARIKGIEQFEKAQGNEALFLTITCPSRMHARHSNGLPNERYNGTSPRQAQAYLNGTWRKAKRKLDHEGIKLSGLRVVEPHHDGCPHWHVLAFVKPEQLRALVQIMQTYALFDSPDEPGAQQHRFKVEQIDPAKGSAVGYVAKYVAKNIDGEGVDLDNETEASGKDAAPRIVAWARTWAIRQFQFFGVPAITPTRELYRIQRLDVPSQGLQEAHKAVKANDYGQWLHVYSEFQLSFKTTYTDRKSSRYADETVQRLQGLTASANDLQLPALLTTRVDEWRIEPRKKEPLNPDLSPPWTRFNNCAPIDFKEFFDSAINFEPEGISKTIGRVGHGVAVSGRIENGTLLAASFI